MRAARAALATILVLDVSATVINPLGPSSPAVVETATTRAELAAIRQSRVSRARRPQPLTGAAPKVAVAAVRRTAPKPKPRPKPKAKPSKTRAQRVIDFALAQRGEPYVFGAAGPNAWDCSGLIVGAYRTIGIRLPHYTGALLRRGRRVSKANLRPGDLVFTSSHHVGLYLGGGRMVVAPHSGAVVRVQSVYSFYTARRIL